MNYLYVVIIALTVGSFVNVAWTAVEKRWFPKDKPTVILPDLVEDFEKSEGEWCQECGSEGYPKALADYDTWLHAHNPDVNFKRREG